jgi:hypothetical protein
MAAALKDVAELAEEAGAAFHMLSGSIAENAGQMLMLEKGLGMSNAALIEMTRQAQNAGEDVGDMLTATASMAIQMGDKFGISAKTMGKNMSDLTENFEKLGKMSTKQLGATAAYMAKLGLEASDLLGVVDKFDDFEGAAESVSMLNQSMGMQLDTMEMMNAENPAERIDMMRDAFHETGKSVDDLTRQEKALMAEQMGLSVTAMENALAAENQGVSYEDMEAGAEEAEEQALTQEEAMSKLADSIEKMTEGGGGGLTGFFDAFAKGFMKGLKQSKAFQEVLKSIRAALKIVFQFGKQVGKMFADLMGEMGVWDGIKDLFDPKDLRNLMGIDEKGGLTGTGLLGIFKKFKDALTGKGNYSPQNMAEDMGKEFSKFFSAKGPAFKKLGDAFAKGIKMLGAIISGLIPWVVEKLSDMIKGLADAVRNPPDLAGAASQGIGGAIMEAVMSIGKALLAAVPVLLSAILDLLAAVFVKHGGKIIMVGAALASFVFLKMLIIGAISAAKAALFQVVVKKLTDLMTGGMEKSAKKAEKGGKAGKKMGESFKTGMKSMASGLKSFAEEIASIKVGTILKAALIMALMALSFIPVMAIFALGLVVVALVLSLVPFGMLIKGLTALAMAVPVVAMMVYAALLIQPAMIVPALIGLLAGALLLTVGGVVFTMAMGVIGMAVGAVGVGTIMMAAVGLAALAVGSVAVALAIVPFAILGALYPLAILASIGLIAGAYMLAIGGVAFTEAMGEIGKAVQTVGVATIGAAAVGLIVLAIGAVAAALAAAAFSYGIPFFIVGTLGAALGGAFLAIGGVAFIIGVALFSDVASGLDMGSVAKSMIALVLLAGASVLVAAILSYGLAYFAVGIAGALVGALFFLALAKAMMPQIVKMKEAAPKDMMGAASDMAQLALLMGAAVITAMITAYGVVAFAIGTVAALIATLFFKVLGEHTFPALDDMQKAAPKDMPKAVQIMAELLVLMALATLTAFVMSYGVAAYLVGTLGAYAAIPFFNALTTFYPALEEFANAVNLKTLEKGAQAAAMLAIVMVAAALMGVVSLVMIIFANPIVAWLAKKGMQAAGSLLEAVVEYLGPSIAALATMKIKNPAGLEAIVSALSQIMAALGQNVDIVAKLALLQAFGSSSGNESSILKDAESFMTAMFDGMSGLLNTLKRMVASMKEEDIKKMEAIGGVLAAIGKLMQALQPPPGLMEGISDLASGGLFSSGDAKGASDLLKQYGEMMKTILMAVKDNIPPMLEEIMKIDVGDDPELAKTKAEVIGAALGGIAKVVEAIGGIVGLFMEQNQSEQSGIFSSEGPSMADTLKEMKPVFEYVFTAIKDNIPAIMGAVMSVDIGDDPEAAKQKIEIIGAAMGAVADFAGAIGTVAELMPAEGGSFFKKGKTMSERLNEMMEIVRKVVNAVKAHIGPLVASVLEIPIKGDPETQLKKLEVIGKAMSIVGDFANVVGQLQEMGTDSLLGLASTIQIAVMSITAAMPWFGVLFTALGGFEGDEALLEKLNIAKSSVESLTSFATAMNEATATMGEGGMPLGEAVAQLVGEAKFALEQLNSIGEVNAEVALDNFASAIGTGGGEFTISNEPITISLNVSVTMDANKVGRVLVDKSVMSTPLAAAE